MYSPRIHDDLIRRIYQLGRHSGKSMVAIVDDILRPVIENLNSSLFSEIEAEEKVVKELSSHFYKLLTDRKKKTAEVIELLRKIA